MGKHHAVELTVYTEDGTRIVVGEAEVELNPISREMHVVNQVYNDQAERFGVIEKVVPGMYSLGFEDVD